MFMLFLQLQIFSPMIIFITANYKYFIKMITVESQDLRIEII